MFLNDFVKLFRTAHIDCIASFAAVKKSLCGLQDKLRPGNKLHEVLINYKIILVLPLLTLEMKLLASYSP